MKIRIAGQENTNNPSNIYNKCHLDSPGIAEIERLGAKLDAMRNGKKKQIILITSSVIGEGKSTVASLLARCMAIHRNETLLIDFDVRRPRLHTIFDISRKDGLIDNLRSTLPFNLCVKPTFIPRLNLMSSGILDVSPSEILNTDLVKTFFKNLGKQFDCVIVDSAPVIHVSEPLLISKFVDEVVLVVKAGSTPKYVVKRAIDMFKDVKVDISGIILNNMQNVLPHYYDYNSYGYQYYEYMDDDKPSKEIVRKHGIWNWKS